VLYPIPATNTLVVDVFAQEDVTAHFTLTSLSGRPVINRTERMVQGNNNITIPIDNIPSGVYILTMVVGKERILKRVLIGK
jgi:hypothetical protein